LRDDGAQYVSKILIHNRVILLSVIDWSRIK